MITALDVFLILYLQNIGFRYVEAFVIALLARDRLVLRRADRTCGSAMGRRGARLCADDEIVTNPDMLYLALGILGATVMPHNLYLHSGIVQTRAYGDTCPSGARPCASQPSIPPSR